MFFFYFTWTNWVFVNCMAQMIKQSRSKKIVNTFVHFITQDIFKLSLLHCSFMGNKSLDKIQKHVNQSKHMHNTFLSEVSHN